VTRSGRASRRARRIGEARDPTGEATDDPRGASAKQTSRDAREVSRLPQTGKGMAFQSRDTSSLERKASQRGGVEPRKRLARQSPRSNPGQGVQRSVGQAPKAATKGSAFQARSSGKMERKASQRGGGQPRQGRRRTRAVQAGPLTARAPIDCDATQRHLEE